MIPLVVKDGLAQGHRGINLGAGRMSGFMYFRLEGSGFRGGKGGSEQGLLQLQMEWEWEWDCGEECSG